VSQPKAAGQRGQSLVESTLILLVFFLFLFAVIDCGQVMLAHESLVERARTAVRWASVHPWDGTGEQTANMLLFNQPDEPLAGREGYLGLTRANVQVRYQPSVPEHPDDEIVTLSVINFRYQFLSPWFGKAMINPRPVTISAPMAYRPSITAAVR
jgi:hypothetical protein